MSSFEAALTEIQRRARSVQEQGEQFERLIAAALARHPGIYGDRFTRVWRWADWPGHRYADIGIDLVAEAADGGGLCAIQCKFYAADRAVPKGAIDSFMSTSEPVQFTSRLLVNTGQPRRHHALRVLLDSPKPCKVLDRNQLAGWEVDWSQYVDRPADLQFNAVDRHRPYPYQQEAIDHVRQGFAAHARGQLVLPCGTGKTEVTLWLDEKMVTAGGRVLYLVPSIALMAQTMRVWAEQKNVPHRYVGICSDTRAGRTDMVWTCLSLSLYFAALWLVAGAPPISALPEVLQSSRAGARAGLAALSIPSVQRLFGIVVLVVVAGLAVQAGVIVLQRRPWQAWRRRRGWPVRESLDIARRRGPRG